MTDEAQTAVLESAPVVETAAPPAEPTTAKAPESVDQMSYDKLMSELKDTRSENAKRRVSEREAKERLDAVLKAAGGLPDDDPVKVAKRAAEEREAARSVAKNLAVENAVLRQAAKAGANPDALTDSRSFMRELEQMDPEAEDFAAKVAEAIAKAVEANPLLKREQAVKEPPVRSGGPVGGGPGVAGQLSREDLKTMSPEAIVQADKDGRLEGLKKAAG